MTRPHSPRGAAADPARKAAYRVLRAVSEQDAYANLVLPAILGERSAGGRGLDERERALATELAYGSLRAQGSLDVLIGLVSSRPVAGIDPPLLDALRLGAYQLLRTRIPPRAAVAATVELVRSQLGPSVTGFANAVLRRVSERVAESGGDVAAALGAPPRDSDPIGWLALVHAHPRWVVEAFAAALSDTSARLTETEAALRADNAAPSTHLAVRPGGPDRDAVLAEADQAGMDPRPGPWSPWAVRLRRGDPGRLACVRSGAVGVQDEGSQLCALALARAPLAGGKPGAELVVDLCAGPGGKAALLSTLLPDSALVAVEPAAHRARLVHSTLVRLPEPGASLTIQADGRTVPLAAGAADRVLVDAPCTGLGALRRRPEARWRRTEADLGPLLDLQRDLLASAVALLRPGGVLAYVTCSPHLAEARGAVAGLAGAGLELLDARTLLPEMPLLGDGPQVQLWPHRHGTDAMALTLLRRPAAG